MDTVRTVAAWAHAHIGDTDAALASIDAALASPFAQGRFETLLEAADVVGTYIDPDRGANLLAEAEAVGARTDAERTYLAFFRAETLMRLGLPDDARVVLDSIAEGRHTGYPGFYVRVKLARAVAAFLTGSPEAASLLAGARAQAELQGATGALRAIQLLASLESGSAHPLAHAIAVPALAPKAIVGRAVTAPVAVL